MVPVDEKTEIDPTIVHPGKLKMLSPELCEAICQECHLPGEARVLRRGRDMYDFRPGLPLQSVWSIFVSARKGDEKWKAVNHVEQMYLSKCFLNSHAENKLGCISCHDPHVKVSPEQRVVFYRQRCMHCHHENASTTKIPGCTVPLVRRESANHNSCFECHMPRYAASDIAHTASTNHRIVRLPEEHAEAGLTSPQPLVPFHKADFNDKEFFRDLGIALVTGQKSPAHASEAVPLLEMAIENDPDDLQAWRAKGMALLGLGKPREALAAFETVLEKDPAQEVTASLGGTAARNALEWETATQMFRRARDLNPWMPAYRGGLAAALAAKGHWGDASRECLAWVRLDPDSVAARKLWIQCLIKTGQSREAQAELGRVIVLRPKDRDELEAWFGRERRAR